MPPLEGRISGALDLPGSPAISTQANRVTATTMATTLGGEAFSVSTVEHCLSTLAALRIDNLFIELDGPEIPIGDGSAAPFLEAILAAGLAVLWRCLVRRLDLAEAGAAAAAAAVLPLVAWPADDAGDEAPVAATLPKMSSWAPSE